MAILPVYSCFHPVLKKKVEKIDNINDEIVKLVNDMFDTMYNADGIGLAGNQVGVSKAIITIDVGQAKDQDTKQPLLMLNPEIIKYSEDSSEYQEGCLSVPTLYENVVRPKEIQIRYIDINGTEHIEDVDELLARVMQHEVDHLNGIVFVERLSAIKRTFIRNRLRKIQKGLVVPDYIYMGQDNQILKK